MTSMEVGEMWKWYNTIKMIAQGWNKLSEKAHLHIVAKECRTGSELKSMCLHFLQ